MESIQLNVNLNFQQLVEAIKHLTPTEKLRINEALWEENMEIPPVHQALVMDRIYKAEEDPTRLMDWKTVSPKLKP